MKIGDNNADICNHEFQDGKCIHCGCKAGACGSGVCAECNNKLNCPADGTD